MRALEGSDVTLSKKDAEVSERLRELIRHEYGSRGRFSLLEQASGLPATRWKNFYYGKQSASPEMIEFARRRHPERETWLITGERIPPNEGLAFSGDGPRKAEVETIRDRLNWVIREWAAPRGEHLFDYLEEKSGGTIKAGEWAQVILGRSEPSLAMFAVVAQRMPEFLQWVLLGSAAGDGVPQVDPTDEESVKAWKNRLKEGWGPPPSPKKPR